MVSTSKQLTVHALVCLFLLGGAIALSLAAEKVTIVVTVADGHQLVGDDGYPYEVEDTDMGNKLVLQHIGRKVEVTGTVKETIDYRVIDVDSFRVIEED